MPVGIRGFDAPDRPETSPRVQAFFADDRGVHRGADFSDSGPRWMRCRDVTPDARSLRCAGDARCDRGDVDVQPAARGAGEDADAGKAIAHRSAAARRSRAKRAVRLSRCAVNMHRRTIELDPSLRRDGERGIAGAQKASDPPSSRPTPGSSFANEIIDAEKARCPTPGRCDAPARSIRRPDPHFITFRRFSSIHLLACAGSYARIHASIWSMSLPYQRSARWSGCRKRSSTMRSIMPISGA